MSDAKTDTPRTERLVDMLRGVLPTPELVKAIFEHARKLERELLSLAHACTEAANLAVRTRCIRCGADWLNGQLVDPYDVPRQAVRRTWERVADKHAFAYSPEYLNDGTVDAMMEFAREYQDAAPQAPSPGVVQNPGGKADLHSASPAVAAPFIRCGYCETPEACSLRGDCWRETKTEMSE